MGQKVCLDSDVAIEMIKETPSGVSVFRAVQQSEMFIASTTLFELLLRRNNLDAVERFVERVNVLPFDDKSARLASVLHKQLREKGTPVEFRDIFIAATAMTNGCILSTLNIKDFSMIPRLKLLEA
jgi:tRNA(fMet)-specific endonuclease VapC